MLYVCGHFYLKIRCKILQRAGNSRQAENKYIKRPRPLNWTCVCATMLNAKEHTVTSDNTLDAKKISRN